MAVLSEADRAEIWAEFMRRASAQHLTINATKAELRQVFDALDGFFNDNAAAINSAIPQPMRANLSAAVKSLIAIAVLEKRYLSGV